MKSVGGVADVAGSSRPIENDVHPGFPPDADKTDRVWGFENPVDCANYLIF